jgi:hypothetical protein
MCRTIRKGQFMRFPWLAAEYIRTCAGCGYTWRVPRAFARRRFESLSTSILENNLRTRATGGLDPQLMPRSGGAAAGEQREAFRHCPRCDSEHFAQRPARD